MEKVLPTREELVAQNYPYGMSAPGIPMGNPEVEWQRSQPDVVVYRPQMPAYDGDNEHFLVFMGYWRYGPRVVAKATEIIILCLAGATPRKRNGKNRAALQASRKMVRVCRLAGRFL